MPRKKQSIKPNMGTAWFLAILVIAILAAFFPTNISTNILLLILAICGAMVAAYNITIQEENQFLISTTALIIISMAFMTMNIPDILKEFLSNLVVGIGVAGFIVAISLVFKLAIQK
ncbi:MAG: hypothetical protein J7K26_00880 [Candidatus Aenigmarchaeota archaeon]|nr:hypothetical protein [Candidatus Aenigmarchaeota archaeon]